MLLSFDNVLSCVETAETLEGAFASCTSGFGHEKAPWCQQGAKRMNGSRPKGPSGAKAGDEPDWVGKAGQGLGAKGLREPQHQANQQRQDASQFASA
jgi:hypothetical protein